MKSCFLLLILLCGVVPAYGQPPDWQWADAAGGPNAQDLGLRIVADGAGNNYTTGYHYDSVMVVGTTTLTHPGMFVIKRDPFGNPLWAKESVLPVPTNFSQGWGIAVDSSGNCYVSGIYWGDSISFGPLTLHNPSYGSAIFLVKYDPNGNELWAKTSKGIGYGLSIAVEGAGNILLAGYFETPTLELGGAVLANSGTIAEIFLARFDPAGTLLWSRTAGGTGGEIATAIVAEPSGGFYISGQASAPFTIDAATIVHGGGFIARFDGGGNGLWAQDAEVIGVPVTSYPDIALADDGSCYVVGTYGFGPVTFGGTTLPNGGSYDGYFAKYDPAGNLIWATNVSGPGMEQLFSVDVDPSGNPVIAGFYSSQTLTIGATTLQNTSYWNLFVASYDSGGAPLWMKGVGGNGQNEIRDISISPAGAIYFTGFMSQSAVFGNIPLATVSVDLLTGCLFEPTAFIGGTVFNDLDEDGMLDPGEPGLPNWTVVLDGPDPDTVVTNADGEYTFFVQTVATVRLSAVPQPSWLQSVPLPNQYVVTVDSMGQYLSGYHFGEVADTKRWRTFNADTALSIPVPKFVFSAGILSPPMGTIRTALENVFIHLGKPGAVFLGIPQSNSFDAKKYGWVVYNKAANFAKMYTNSHTGQPYPIDTLRGSPPKKLYGLLIPKRSIYNNVAWSEGIIFHLNLIASTLGITPKGFGDLVIDTSYVFMGRQLQDMTLKQVAGMLDTAMTYYGAAGITTPPAYAELGDLITYIIKPINDRFSTPVAPTNVQIDSFAISTADYTLPNNAKNPWAMRLLGHTTASQAGIVRYVPGTPVPPSLDPSSVPEQEMEFGAPERIALEQNYPNPFNPSTNIAFSLPEAARVTLIVYNTLGQQVATLFDGEALDAGGYEIAFSAPTLASGVYFYRLSGTTAADGESAARTFSEIRKMLLVR